MSSPAPSCTTHATGRWTSTGALNAGRAGHTATLLPNGQVLVAGGNDAVLDALASAELYDHATGRWTPTGSLSTGRTLHTATLLPSGQVLVAGGQDSAGHPLASAELYDPTTGRWATTGSLATSRFAHTATLLPSGQILVAGGLDSAFNAFASAELYDPGLGFQEAWRPRVTAVGPVAVGGAVGVEGSFFQGLSEASGANGSRNSATNYPLVQLRRLDSEQTVFLPIDPVAGWSDNSFTSLPLASFPPGWAFLTVITNGIPSISLLVHVSGATLACPPPSCDSPRANLRLGRVRVSPNRVRLGQPVEVTTTLRTANTAVFDLIVRFYDGDPKDGGQVFAAERIPQLPAHGSQELHVLFTPTVCGSIRLVVVAGQGLPIEDERRSGPLRVDCRAR